MRATWKRSIYVATLTGIAVTVGCWWHSARVRQWIRQFVLLRRLQGERQSRDPKGILEGRTSQEEEPATDIYLSEDAVSRSVTVIYASVTGTAESAARELANKCAKLFGANHVQLINCEAIDSPADLLVPLARAEGVTVATFCIATHGDGEPPTSANSLFHWLEAQTDTSNKPLEGLKVAVMGFGNRSYAQFNYAAHTLAAHLTRLGAHFICVVGEADDSNDECEFETWLPNQFLTALKPGYTPSSLGLDDSDESALALLPTELRELPRAQLCEQASWTEADTVVSVPEKARRGARNIWSGAILRPSVIDVVAKPYFSLVAARVKVVRPLLQKQTHPWSCTVHMEIDLRRQEERGADSCNVETLLLRGRTGGGIGACRPHCLGDTVQLLPENPPDLVEWFLTRLVERRVDPLAPAPAPSSRSFLPTTILHFPAAEAGVPVPFPVPCSLRHILQFYTDLCGEPTREILRQLTVFVTNPLEKNFLASLLSFERRAQFAKFARHCRLSLRGFFELFFTSACFASSEQHLAATLLLLPRQKIREFSSSSSPLEDGLHSVALTVGCHKLFQARLAATGSPPPAEIASPLTFRDVTMELLSMGFRAADVAQLPAFSAAAKTGTFEETLHAASQSAATGLCSTYNCNAATRWQPICGSDAPKSGSFCSNLTPLATCTRSLDTSSDLGTATEAASLEQSQYFPPEAEGSTHSPTEQRPSPPPLHLPKCHVAVRLVESRLRLPPPTCPIIMVGTGTGVAPFRAFWRQLRALSRRAWKRSLRPSQRHGMDAERATDPQRRRQRLGLHPVAALFFGCTHPSVDFLYRDELLSASVAAVRESNCSPQLLGELTKRPSETEVPEHCASVEGEEVEGPPPALTHLFLAFSRLDPSARIYVQDLLLQQANLLRDALGSGSKRDGYLFICGSPSMAQGVKSALRFILGHDDYETLLRARRVIEEVWS